MKEIESNDPIDHAKNIKATLNELTAHLRKDISKVDDSKAQALFETSAEVIEGLSKAFADYINKREPAWR
jgi:hypothetical protein